MSFFIILPAFVLYFNHLASTRNKIHW